MSNAEDLKRATHFDDVRRSCCGSMVNQEHRPHCAFATQEPGSMPFTAEQTVLQEANNLIYGDRQAQYGSARQNFGDIAALWSVVLGKEITAEQVALCLIQLKIARAMRDVETGKTVKRDTMVDIAGYAGCLEKLEKGL